MMHKAWCSMEEVPYCFPRSSIKFQGHKGQNIADFDTNWEFPECNCSLNSPMDLKWYTKLDVLWKRCLLFFEVIHQISRSHGLKIDDLDQIWARLLGQSQLSNPLDLPCLLRKSLQWAPHISAVRVRYRKLSGAYLFGTQHIKHYKVDEFLHFAQLIETPWLSPVPPVREEVFIPQSVLFHWCTCSQDDWLKWGWHKICVYHKVYITFVTRKYNPTQ